MRDLSQWELKDGLTYHQEDFFSSFQSTEGRKFVATWMAVLWPKLGTMRARREFSGIRRLVGKRLLLSLTTYLADALVAFFLAPQAIQMFWSNTHFLPPLYFSLLLIAVGIDLLVGLLGAILLTGNRVPQLNATLLTGFLALAFAVLLSRHVGLLGIVVAPALAQISFNLWNIIMRLCWIDLRFSGGIADDTSTATALNKA